MATAKISKKKANTNKKRENKERLEQLAQDYKLMLHIRRFEERAGQLYGMGLIGGFCHLYIGQEAVVAGIQSALIDGDCVITSYRDHGHMIACGLDDTAIMAELTGRATGLAKGKGGSMHMFSREKNFYGGHGIVGAQVPIGTGIAFALKYRETPNVCVAYMGDGALNQGQVYESFNMASLWQLPVIYVIENNGYAMGTAVNRAAAHGTSLYERGKAYDIPGIQADGMNVEAMRDATYKALEHVRGGNGPYIIEAMTYRYRGHSMSDPAKYRPKEEVEDMRRDHDPIAYARDILLAESYVSEDELKEWDKTIKTAVSDAANKAKEAPELPPEELYTDILVEAM